MTKIFEIIFLLVVAVLAKRLKVLSTSGAVAGYIVALIVVFFGGTPAVLSGLFYFISTSALTKIGKKFKSSLGFEKLGNRDAEQVLATALIPVTFLILGFFYKNPIWLVLGYLGGVATDNADTWATEIGALSKNNPRLITSFKKVSTGRSGAVSLLGLSAAFVGSLIIALFIYLWQGNLVHVWAITIGAFVGTLADSFLGATIQAQRQCRVCQNVVETHTHHSQPTSFISGLSWVNNQVVNFASSLIGALLVIYLSRFF